MHEYLIKNHFHDHAGVWMRTLDPYKNQMEMTKTVRELLENDPDEQKKELVNLIKQCVQEKDMAKPAVIRFARFDAGNYSRKLGLPDRYYVFVSNLAEIWNVRVTDAADLSGHTFKTGDTVYVWAFLPERHDEVIPATWGEILKHLPTWLSEIEKN